VLRFFVENVPEKIRKLTTHYFKPLLKHSNIIGRASVLLDCEPAQRLHRYVER
jgi:hypothetical protein